jgi:maltooligosyltrehalose synthase
VLSRHALADGRAKMLLLREGLRWRREDPELLAGGDYEPLPVDGPLEAHVVAFARRVGGRVGVCVAPRLWWALTSGATRGVAWQGRVRVTEAPAAFVEIVSGRRVTVREGGLALEEALAGFPVALLRPAPG